MHFIRSYVTKTLSIPNSYRLNDEKPRKYGLKGEVSPMGDRQGRAGRSAEACLHYKEGLDGYLN